MLTSGPALQMIRQQPSEVQAFRDLARRYNPLIMRQAVESYSMARRSGQPGHSTTMGEAPMEIGAVYGDKGKIGKHAKGKKGEDKGKGKHKGKHESSPKFEVTVESGDTNKKTVDIRTLLPKWMRSLSNNQTAVRAAARYESSQRLSHACLSTKPFHGNTASGSLKQI